MGDSNCTSAVWDEVNWRAPAILSKNRFEEAVAHLVEYFGPVKGYECEDRPVYQDQYTGASFNEVGGGGDRAGTANVVTGDDIVSLQLLSVTPPTLHSLQLLGAGVTGQGLQKAASWRAGLDYDAPLMKADIPAITDVPIDAEAVTRALSLVPRFTALAEIPPVEIDDVLRAVDILWREVRRSYMGPTMVSKLLARKRLGLLPVIDDFIRKQLKHGDGRTDFYRSMWRVMSDEQLDLPGHLQSLRDTALGKSGDERIGRLSDLRVFDIVVWRQQDQINRGHIVE